VPAELTALRRLATAAPVGFKFNPYHDELGRFTFAPGGGEDDSDDDDDNDASPSEIARNFLSWALSLVGTAHAQEADDEDNKPTEGNDTFGDIKAEYYFSSLQILYELDPDNHDFDSISGPDWVPSDDEINRLNVAISAASQQRVMNFVMPNDEPVGEEGSSSEIRVLPGGLE
jgi:hypothetical protein